MSCSEDGSVNIYDSRDYKTIKSLNAGAFGKVDPIYSIDTN